MQEALARLGYSELSAEGRIAELQDRADAQQQQLNRVVLALRAGVGGGAPLPLAEIGELLGVTRERVRYMLARAHRQDAGDEEEDPDLPAEASGG